MIHQSEKSSATSFNIKTSKEKNKKTENKTHELFAHHQETIKSEFVE